MGAPKKPFKVPGTRGLAIVRTAVDAGRFEEDGQSDRAAAGNCNAHGYLERDKKTASVWYPTEKAREMLAWLQSEISGGETLPVAAAVPGAGVARMEGRLQQAKAYFDDNDVFAARRLAQAVYIESKAGGKFSKQFHLSDSLEACRRIQGDAASLVINTKMRIAEEWEKAGDEGKTHKGRPKSVSHENAFTAEEAGLTRQDIYEGNLWRKAVEKEPGIVERAIAARLQAGLEPSVRSLRSQIGTKTATKEERGDNLYETPDVAVLTLLALEDFSPVIWEPACGKGAILRVLEAAGHDVLIGDLVDYGTATKDGECQDVGDFLDTVSSEWPAGKPDIVTNPPYGTVLNAFVAHALRVHRPQKMALLLNANFWFGFEDEDREYALQENPPARKISFKRRLPMMHRDGWTGPKASSSMNTAWFIWELQPDGTYGNQTIDIRVDWKDYVTEAVAEAAEAAESEAA